MHHHARAAGRSWKRLYFERNLEGLIENCKPEDEEVAVHDVGGILDIAQLSAPYVDVIRRRHLFLE
jgi:hypothetical protein